MKALLNDIGALIALKRLNRDQLAQSIGTTRQNLLAAVKGRRPLPAAYAPPLRRALGLDETYLLEAGRVHGLTVANGEKQREQVEAVLRRFMTWPVQNRWLLRGIGEDGKEGCACAFEDARGVLVIVRNDDSLLFRGMEAESGETAQLFMRDADMAERETPLARFDRLFSGPISEAECRAMLRSEEKVWTWSRLRAFAEAQGYDAQAVLRLLNRDNGPPR